ncbi:DMT family transporter [Endothiovibrio diazotrophicus]
MDSPRRATLYGLVAVTAFAATLPMTRLALDGFPPLALTFARLLGAALAALVALAVVGARLPQRRHWGGLAVVAFGGTGFPLLVALALEGHEAAPGAIPLALIPLATAAWTRLRGHERPAPAFWLWAAAGAGLVLHFAWGDGAGKVAPELYLAALIVAPTYAEGGRLAREMPGWQVMAWAVLFAAPFSALGFGLTWAGLPAPHTPAPWLALTFLVLVSQLGGFWFWYRALAAGVASGAQLMLLQPFLTLLLAGLLLGESIPPALWLYAAGVVVAIRFARRPPSLPQLIKETQP